MGIPVSLAWDPKDIPVRTVNSRNKVKLFPRKRQGIPGEVVLEFSAYPKELGEPCDEVSPYWWVDCQFVPYDSSQLVVSAGAYSLRTGLTWVQCKGVRAGLITHWQISQDELCCGVLKGTTTTSRPKIQLHPDGKYLGFVGRGCVRVVDTYNNDRYIKDDAIRPVSYKYCTFSPDGVYLAVLYRIQCHFELEISRLDIRLLRVNTTVCHNVCPSFTGTRSYTEQVECHFSPDSSLIALSHSEGILFTVNKRDLSLHSQLFPGVDSGVSLSNERSYDFDPTSGHSFIAAGGNNGHIFLIDIDTCKVLHEEDLHIDAETVDCVKYSPNGDCLAIAISDFTIRLFCPYSRQVTMTLGGETKCPGIQVQACSGRLPVVIRMSFDRSGEHLAISSTDGQVRIWQLPIKMDLRYLCKLKIQQCCIVTNIKMLPLPNSVINYLLSPT
ncbi:uncharacterized protein LOC135473975 [Liolophura sinensis]|uniref:uncharacterized protein LOC135473975 n=1 Tax=Liolophura sinensis TaxID=3198878 RepID=UPI00315867B2